MVENADLSEDGRAHQLEEAKAGLAIPVTLEIRILLWQYLVPGIPYGAVFLNVGINQLVQISSVSPELFRIAVCLAARKYCRDYKRRMSKKTVLYRERARNLPYCDLFDING